MKAIVFAGFIVLALSACASEATEVRTEHFAFDGVSVVVENGADATLIATITEDGSTSTYGKLVYRFAEGVVDWSMPGYTGVTEAAHIADSAELASVAYQFWGEFAGVSVEVDTGCKTTCWSCDTGKCCGLKCTWSVADFEN